jgi:hypothetical protein
MKNYSFFNDLMCGYFATGISLYFLFCLIKFSYTTTDFIVIGGFLCLNLFLIKITLSAKSLIATLFNTFGGIVGATLGMIVSFYAI